ncbi:MAG TPA: dephospho-CoA kinase, partial [Pyrinomonadaceae bacterium]|nr:dephospho-CoA kinase [Pyrinomonadaceae bacterium]
MPGTAGLKALTEAFGEDILTTDGTLDRKRLGALIFADQSQRERLNHILHPFIIARQDEIMNAWEAEDPDGIGIIDAALMIESGGYKRFDKLIVVHCRPEVQLERLMLRDKLSRDEALRRINSQMPQEEKQKFADYLIDTSDGFELTRSRSVEIYHQLIRVIRG